MVEPEYYNTAGHPRIGSTTSSPENNLSAAAQAVDDAFWKTINDKWNIYDRRRAQLAAALRAAAKELGPRRELEPGYIFSAPAEQWHHEFRLEAERKLLAIADELEQ